jgi:GH24 family phage-related lysozyme (muramidase)
VQDADGSTKYVNSSANERIAFNKTISALCAADLNPITPTIKPGQKALLIALYKLGVNALAAEGWLTKTQAGELSSLASEL